MASDIRVAEFSSVDRSSMWVESADAYKAILPEPEKARYTLTRSTRGISELAVRGYSNGHPLSLASNFLDDGVVIGDKTYRTGLEWHKRLLEVPADQQDEFQTAMRTQEDPATIGSTRSLARVYEEGIEGNWKIWLPAGLDIDPDQVMAELYHGPSWSDFVGIVDYPHDDGYYYFRGDAPVIPARISRDGPEFRVVTSDDSINTARFAASSIACRVAPQKWVEGRVLSGVESEELASLVLDFAFSEYARRRAK